jgi:hypothetical protein
MGQIERLLPALPSQEEESGRICALDGVLR